MEVLTNKQLKSYKQLSRYATFPLYYNTNDNKYMYGTTDWLKLDTKYTLYKVKYGDTLDSIALDMYKNPTYYWIICDFNRITDPFITLTVGSYLRIPVLSTIEFGE